ncbi:hypothetical protein CBR_g8501 [Chara braunii]|uniref:CCHC-type domain-containing protein n=1 Tax=Chara braunii TaxID=69332 RepID=A0A388KMH5_CHABU|nr:hypothetical protein CBR_g8501 [Chara braunii]|eukprot:GBG71198.1 hypothetical protein CBR_g8501 [Chara braunii]
MASEEPRNHQGGYNSGGGERDRSRDRERDQNWDRDRDRDRERARDGDRDRNQRKGPPRCFKCNSIGHYANQCSWFDAPSTFRDSYRGRSTSPRRGHQAKSSSSGESQMASNIEKLGQNVASLQEYVKLELSKKSKREAKKKVKELAKQREEEERMERERRIARKAEKERKAKEKNLKLAKSVDLQLSLKIGELREEIRHELRRVIKGKAKDVKQACSRSTSDSNGNGVGGVDGLSAMAGRLTINEKRKRGEEPVFEDSPPMEIPPKRTPAKCSFVKPIRLTSRLKSRTPETMLRTKLKRRSRQASNKKIPAECGELGRLRYLDSVRRDLIDLDAKALEALCKKIGIEYRGKINAIFDIADSKASLAYNSAEECEATETDLGKEALDVGSGKDVEGNVEDSDDESEAAIHE